MIFRTSACTRMIALPSWHETSVLLLTRSDDMSCSGAGSIRQAASMDGVCWRTNWLTLRSKEARLSLSPGRWQKRVAKHIPFSRRTTLRKLKRKSSYRISFDRQFF